MRPGPTPATGLGGLPTPELRAHVVKRATLELEVGRRKGRTTVRQVIDAVGLVGGFVESTDQDGGRARLTVRVPADQFDATLDRMLGARARSAASQVHGQDVTGEVTDLDARLRNLRAQEAVLLDLMRKATNDRRLDRGATAALAEPGADRAAGRAAACARGPDDVRDDRRLRSPRTVRRRRGRTRPRAWRAHGTTRSTRCSP